MARMPVRAVRVPDDEWDAWEAAARDQGDSVASMIRDVMNAHVGGAKKKAAPRGKAAKAAMAQASAAAACPRAHFHRPGTWCKACGVTPA